MTTRPRTRASALAMSVLLVSSILLASVAFAGTASAQTSQADVVFVFDETGSMDSQAQELQNEVTNVANELDSSGIDARYALITYEDADSTEVDQHLTSDPGDIESALEGFDTFGGTENASHGVLMALNNLEYRNDAQKIVVVITDEDDDGTQSSRDAAMQQLSDDEACLVAVAPEHYSGSTADELKTMAEEMAECGQWTDINSGFSTNVITDLVDFIQEETDSVTGPSFHVEDRSVEPGTVYTGETATVSVDVRNSGDSGGEYDALLVDRGLTFRYDETVYIGPGETRTLSIPVSYDEPGEYSLRYDYQYGLSLTVEERPPADLNESDIEVVNGTDGAADDETDNTTGAVTEVSSIQRSIVASNETYEVTALVENTGNETGVASVVFGSGDDGVNSTVEEAVKNVTLDPGETATVTYNATVKDAPAETVTRTWTVNGEPVGNVTVLGSDDASTGLIDAYTEPSTVAPAESYDVVGVLYNDDDTERPVAVNFAREQDTLGSLRFVSVPAGETVTVTHTVEAPADADEGVIEWYVNREHTSVEVVP